MESEELHEMVEWDPEKGVVRTIWMTERSMNDNYERARQYYEKCILKENYGEERS